MVIHSGFCIRININLYFIRQNISSIISFPVFFFFSALVPFFLHLYSSFFCISICILLFSSFPPLYPLDIFLLLFLPISYLCHSFIFSFVIPSFFYLSPYLFLLPVLSALYLLLFISHLSISPSSIFFITFCLSSYSVSFSSLFTSSSFVLLILSLLILLRFLHFSLYSVPSVIISLPFLFHFSLIFLFFIPSFLFLAPTLSQLIFLHLYFPSLFFLLSLCLSFFSVLIFSIISLSSYSSSSFHCFAPICLLFFLDSSVILISSSFLLPSFLPLYILLLTFSLVTSFVSHILNFILPFSLPLSSFFFYSYSPLLSLPCFFHSHSLFHHLYSLHPHSPLLLLPLSLFFFVPSIFILLSFPFFITPILVLLSSPFFIAILILPPPPSLLPPSSFSSVLLSSSSSPSLPQGLSSGLFAVALISCSSARPRGAVGSVNPAIRKVVRVAGEIRESGNPGGRSC